MLFDTTTPQSGFFRTPQYGGGDFFVNKYGKLTGLGKGVSTVLPAITSVVGGVASAVTGIPGLGEAGGELGKAVVNQALSKSAQRGDGFIDSRENAQSAVAEGVGLATVGGAVGGLAGNFISPGKKAPTTKTSAAVASPGLLPGVLPGMLPTKAASAGEGSSINSPFSPFTGGQTQYNILPPVPNDSGSLFGGTKSKQSSLFGFAAGGPVKPQKGVAVPSTTATARPSLLPFMETNPTGISKSINTTFPELDKNTKQALTRLSVLGNNPAIATFKQPGIDFAFRNGNRPYYDNQTNTLQINPGSVDDYMSEVAHAVQNKNDPAIFGNLTDRLYNFKENNFTHKVDESRYQNPNSYEHQAHHVIQPKLNQVLNFLQEPTRTQQFSELSRRIGKNAFAEGGPVKPSARAQRNNARWQAVFDANKTAQPVAPAVAGPHLTLLPTPITSPLLPARQPMRMPGSVSAQASTTSRALPQPVPFLTLPTRVDPVIAQNFPKESNGSQLRLSAVQRLSGNPAIEPFSGKGDDSRFTNGNRAYLSPVTGAMHINPGNTNDYMEESAHAVQRHNDPFFTFNPVDFGYNVKELLTGKKDESRYANPNSVEYGAHRVISPRLQQAVDYLNPKKRVIQEQALQIAAGKDFAQGGPVSPQKKTSFNFAYGGLAGTVAIPTAYKLYDEKDKTEDLTITDKKTGEPYGAMRIGEYVLPQRQTLSASHIMEQDATDRKKKHALGSMLFEQMSGKPATGLSQQFATGGPVKPRKPTPKRDPSNDPFVMGRQAARVAQEKQDAEKLAQLRERYRTTKDPSARARIAAAASRLIPAPAPSVPVPPVVATKPAPPATTQLPAPTQPTPEKTTSSRRTTVTASSSRRTGAPSMLPPAKTASTPYILDASGTYTVKPGDTLNGIVGKVQGNRPDIMRFNGITDPNKIQAGQVLNLSDPRSVVLTPGVMSRAGQKTTPLPANVTSSLTPSRVNSVPLPVADVVPKSRFDPSPLATGLTDVARLATGVALGSQKVDMPTIPARWLQYDSEVQQRKSQGLTPEEKVLATNSIANNYRQGVNSLGLVTGGGASPGVTLAGLTNLGLQRGQQTQTMLAQDAARRNQNFGIYGAVTGQTAGMESAIQREGINRQANRQAIGANLVGSTLSNIENRQVFNQNAPIYERLLQGQIDKSNEATATIDAIKKRYMTK